MYFKRTVPYFITVLVSTFHLIQCCNDVDPNGPYCDVNSDGTLVVSNHEFCLNKGYKDYDLGELKACKPKGVNGDVFGHQFNCCDRKEKKQEKPSLLSTSLPPILLKFIDDGRLEKILNVYPQGPTYQLNED